MTDFDAAMLGHNPHVTGHADGATRRLVDNRVAERIGAGERRRHVVQIRVMRFRWISEQIRPVAAVAPFVGLEQRITMRFQIEWLEITPRPHQRCTRRRECGTPVEHRITDRLTEAVHS